MIPVKYEMLLEAVRRVYGLVIFANLSKNEYHTLENEHFIRKDEESKGTFDALIEKGASTVPEGKQREQFLAAFGRQELINAYHSGKREVKIEHQQVAEDGRLRWIETRVIFLDGDDAGEIWEITLSKPIDEEKERQMELEKALREAKVASAAKTDFLYNISHDIRTPMNAVMGFLQLAQRSLHNPERALSYLNRGYAASESMMRILEDMLTMVYMESGKLELLPDETDLNLLIEDTENFYRAQMEKKRLYFMTDTSEIVHYHVYCDTLRLKQVILHLLSNAMNYTPDGGVVSYKIRETEAKKEGYASYEISVADTGIGISDEFQKEMFQMFSRESNSTESGTLGTGLGLSVVKRIVDLHGGTIEVNSKVGEGTQMLICISLKICDKK